MRLPARRCNRIAASVGKVVLLVSKRSWAAVETLLTFCPPGPEARTKVISMSFSSMVRSREIRSMVLANSINVVLPGLVPGIAALELYTRNDHGRDKPGHDEECKMYFSSLWAAVG